MPKNLVNNKSVARLAAIQTIYQLTEEDDEVKFEKLLIDIRIHYQNSEIIDQELEKTYGKFKPSYQYLDQLARHTYLNLTFTDQVISKYLTGNWQLSDLPKLLRSILQVAIAELKFLPNTPVKVIIDEYTNIAADLLNSSEIGFVNSLLDRFATDKQLTK